MSYDLRDVIREILQEDIDKRQFGTGYAGLTSRYFLDQQRGSEEEQATALMGGVPAPDGTPALYTPKPGDTQAVRDFISVLGPAYSRVFKRQLIIGSTHRNFTEQASAMSNPLRLGDFDALYRKALGSFHDTVKSFISKGSYAEAGRIMAGIPAMLRSHAAGKGIDIGFSKNKLSTSDYEQFKILVNQVAARYGFTAGLNFEKKNHFHINVSGRLPGAPAILPPGSTPIPAGAAVPASTYGAAAAPTAGQLTSWRGLLGKKFKGNINFHKLADGRNNYRAGIDEEHTVINPQLFQELARDYGIRTVITIHKVEPGRDVPSAVRAASTPQLPITSVYVPMDSSSLASAKKYDTVKDTLLKGNALIHCTHGADRTGAMVGRYYVDAGVMSVDEALSDMKKYKSPPVFDSVKDFVINGPTRK